MAIDRKNMALKLLHSDSGCRGEGEGECSEEILPDDDEELWASAVITGKVVGGCVGVALMKVGQINGEYTSTNGKTVARSVWTACTVWLFLSTFMMPAAEILGLVTKGDEREFILIGKG